ncbi:N-acetylmuramic acid 6-phosphate etherase [Alkaliphilus sp. MSJ-5]|uniref:N-acetylmuramic acid 6-phosphate etherase n=1 Tax=Alkaliphilus flagellatus TaxID=2841507 RepID=A0ABS6FY16_9FIRM|nr:N-acetylmuramic acid 6-phosphate etherase [Alkaliphilus flagellatus]MBU5674884.1 N-acetylmuramic acid 6-phosphate etherase [Alkaliphilus flagellatus]
MELNLSKLITEGRNPNTMNIDCVSTDEMIKMINEEDKKVALAVENEISNIARAVDAIAEKLREGGRLIYMGAGTSGRIGILDASECPPTYGTDPSMVQGLIAGGQSAILKAVEGAEDDGPRGVQDLKDINFNIKDVVVGIAASGRTPYVVSALEYANDMGAITIGVSCNPNSDLAEASQISIAPIVGPEVVTGSTRMKAATAQKMVLNMLSTGVMIKLGKVYQNLMVDMQASNLKLVERAIRIVIQATDISRKEAEEVLKETEYDVKLAILMIESKLSKEDARKLLDVNHGYIRKALTNI